MRFNERGIRFGMGWWTPSGIQNETEYRGKERGEGDFVCNTVPWIDLMRESRILMLVLRDCFYGIDGYISQYLLRSVVSGFSKVYYLSRKLFFV